MKCYPCSQTEQAEAVQENITRGKRKKRTLTQLEGLKEKKKQGSARQPEKKPSAPFSRKEGGGKVFLKSVFRGKKSPEETGKASILRVSVEKKKERSRLVGAGPPLACS